MTYELTPKFDSRASFYGKAKVTEENTIEDNVIAHKLYSYDTHVATILKDTVDDTGTATIYGTYSATTLRHIKEFLKQHNFKADTKAQMVADYKESN